MGFAPAGSPAVTEDATERTDVRNEDVSFVPFVSVGAPRKPVPTVPWIGNAADRFVVSSAVPERFRSATTPRLGVSAVPGELRSRSAPRPR